MGNAVQTVGAAGRILHITRRYNEKGKEATPEAAGWKVGSPREFLGLTDAEVAVVESKLELAKALRTGGK
jgi:hypothetical protein